MLGGEEDFIMNGVKSGSETLQYKVGLVNHAGKYLTGETFGFKVNASGTTMRKKQLWVIEQDPSETDIVYIRSHLGRYISTDKKGNVSADTESPGATEKFTIQYQQGGSGKWAFKNQSNGYFFGATEDNVLCYEKAPTNSEWWTVRLAVHPQVNLRNINRKKYAHLNTENQRIQVDEVIPWGPDALITLEFVNGKYAIKPCNNLYLARTGELLDESNPTSNSDVQFTLEIRSGQYSGMAFRDCNGKYLTAVGREATMKSRNATVSKDELFTLEDSHPQVFITAHNGKMVSTKQGVDLTANQDELTDSETFQVEFDRSTQKWRFRTHSNKYWTLENQGIQAISGDKAPKGLFEMEYLDDGQIALKASNGKYVSAHFNGSLTAQNDSIEPKGRFYMTLVNRPVLVLMCDYGFVGAKTAGSSRLECNKAHYDYIFVEHSNGQSGAYYLKDRNGKYWSVDAEGMVNTDSSSPKPFEFQFREQSKFAIKAPNGKFIKGEQNGIFQAKSDDISKAALWEY